MFRLLLKFDYRLGGWGPKRSKYWLRNIWTTPSQNQHKKWNGFSFFFCSNFWICLQTIFSLDIILENKYLEFFDMLELFFGFGESFFLNFLQIWQNCKEKEKMKILGFLQSLAQKRVKWLTIRKIQVYWLFF